MTIIDENELNDYAEKIAAIMTKIKITRNLFRPQQPLLALNMKRQMANE